MKERDDRVRAENARTQRLIDASNAARAARRGEKKDLLSRLTDPPRPKPSHAGTSDGCTRCRKFYAGHRTKDCPMTATNTWPDAETYTTLTLEKALAAKPLSGTSVTRLPAAAVISSQMEARDDETDSYVDHSPLTVPHLVATLDAFGPNISKFPLPVPALLDIGCPSVVISSDLANELGLRRYPLLPEEDNLSSLSESPLSCREYVKMDQGMGAGSLRCSGLKLILGYLYLSFLECHFFHHNISLLIQNPGLLRIKTRVMTYSTLQYPYEVGHPNERYQLQHHPKGPDPLSKIWQLLPNQLWPVISCQHQ